MMWPIFWPNDTDFSNPANTRHPSEDVGAAAEYIGDQVAAVVAAGGTVGQPAGLRPGSGRGTVPRRAAVRGRHPGRLTGSAGFNGRTQADNAPEAMLSLAAGMAVPSGPCARRSPSRSAARDFPYVVPA